MTETYPALVQHMHEQYKERRKAGKVNMDVSLGRSNEHVSINQALLLAHDISRNPALRRHLAKQGYGKHINRLLWQSRIFWWLMLTLAVFIGMLLR